MVGRSTRAAVWWKGAQESVDRAKMVKHTPFLVARSGYSDYPSVRSSQLSDRALVAQDTGAGSDGESSVAGEDNAVEG